MGEPLGPRAEGSPLCLRRQVWGLVSWLQIKKTKQKIILALMVWDNVPSLAYDTAGAGGGESSTERPLLQAPGHTLVPRVPSGPRE